MYFYGVDFLRFRVFFVHNTPEAEAQRRFAHALSLSCHSRSMRITPLGNQLIRHKKTHVVF